MTINDPLILPNGVTLKNRIVKSAMSEALADADNNPTHALIDLFARWSSGGAALLITGNTPVDRMHLEHAGNFVLDPDTDMKSASALAAAGKSGDAKTLVQLAHAGRQTPEAINASPTSVSDLQLDLPGYGKPTPASESDFEEIIAKFVRSARIAQEVGFDGVEIHAAHGYLLSSALSSRINTRTDRWGGSLGNRARLVIEVVKAVRSAVNPYFIVAVKLNSSDFQKGGFDHAEAVQVAVMLEAEGIDFIEISGGNFEKPTAYQHVSKSGSTQIREAYFLDYAAAIKVALTIPLMVTGGFRSSCVMNDAISRGKTDLIGIGRPFVADPGFAAKLLSGEIAKAPAVEQNFPPADTLPRGAVLNWFCTQIELAGTTGSPDLAMSLVDGHERYLNQIKLATERLLEARCD
ncbi:NADH:flavin oxidoreductase/NADH oxidase family protein [Mameliella sediminis]|uniref:NADH:flavin oxidoreductase/NADH oxidase family protein n=1 Tax=Mameliella sediminis TaxID=2836866 RepID=UPI001C488252|nr:NADH:flavin oxidoreductase/NADH oxidase family protein [Mameliella sediminis]MBV7396892.1 NADH:flavin oxidoreductase/NADH oxidase family protein [Mameliella sediminis]MBY6116150.1 NADH:flavin oxidoreductase/NADH oxidase family protein [Antarctobacter heliothermus]MBY6146115.1 NADH:flavin oxidoreductase/NADH oxidase family protein [Mameliella alba]MCA0955300.1 NADH:flavin oxidoreductase/NADH oxidase family protein [Mameliella alba]